MAVSAPLPPLSPLSSGQSSVGGAGPSGAATEIVVADSLVGTVANRAGETSLPAWVAAVVALLAIVAALGSAPRLGDQGQDPVRLAQEMFRQVIAIVPPQARVQYVTDIRSEQIYPVQFALAPRIIVTDGPAEWLLLDYSSVDALLAVVDQFDRWIPVIKIGPATLLLVREDLATSLPANLPTDPGPGQRGRAGWHVLSSGLMALWCLIAIWIGYELRWWLLPDRPHASRLRIDASESVATRVEREGQSATSQAGLTAEVHPINWWTKLPDVVATICLWIGLSTLVLFACLLITGSLAEAVGWELGVEAVLAVGLTAARLWRSSTAAQDADRATPRIPVGGPPQRKESSASAASALWAADPPVSLSLMISWLAAAIILMIRSWQFLAYSQEWPFGYFDAIAIWNNRAWYLAAADSPWQQMFASAGVFHPDYPLGLSLTVGRFWAWLGEPVPGVAKVIAWLPVPLLVAAWLIAADRLGGAAYRGGAVPGHGHHAIGWRSARLWSGLALLGGAPYWGEFLGQQYADVPLSVWVLVSAVLIVALTELGSRSADQLRKPLPSEYQFGGHDLVENFRLALLAGLAAGLGVWTKNEGWVWLMALGLILGLGQWRRARDSTGSMLPLLKQEWLGFAAGSAPAVIAQAGYAALLAPPNDLVAGQGLAGSWSRLIDAARHGQVLEMNRWLLFQWPMLTIIGGIVLLGCWNRGGARRWTVGVGVIVVWLAYHVVFVTTPHDLNWHLTTAAHRLVSHVWPVVLLAVIGPSAVSGSTRRSGQTNADASAVCP